MNFWCSHFHTDPYPGRPKILFIGLAWSSHTHAWIDLLHGARFNVRLFASDSSVPPDNWPVKTYVTGTIPANLNPTTRCRMYPPGQVAKLVKGAAWLTTGTTSGFEGRLLAQVIRRWRPDIIHFLGGQGSELYKGTRQWFNLAAMGVLVVQLRGGQFLHSQVYHYAPHLENMLLACHQIIADNPVELRNVRQLGIDRKKISVLTPVPGTGGIDVDAMARSRNKTPSHRHIILWPKAYEGLFSKALPVLEALKLIWHRLPSCTLHMLAANTETRLWFAQLPAEIRQHCTIADRIPRDELLALMGEARVVLAPSLIDGVPNVLYEAMAAGALPIVSPLASICPVVDAEKNVLFARNLYPHEIADVLYRAMTDDALVDTAAKHNLELVRRIADRATIRPRVVGYYEWLAAGQGKRRSKTGAHA